MGNGCSSPLPPLPVPNYLCISIYNADSLVMLYPGKQEIEVVRNAIISNWNEGLTSEKFKFEEDENNPQHQTCMKFKMSGYPFCQGMRSKEDSVNCRLVVAAMLKGLYNLGWKLLVSSDLSRYTDLNSWFFQRQVTYPDSYPFFSIGCSSTDKFQINDCPENLHDMIKQICENVWCNGIQSEDKSNRTYEIKLHGRPWSYVDKKESCSSRNMLRDIIQKLSGRQYELYANSDLTGTADTLFFRYNPNLSGEEQHLVISLNRNDRIRLINVPDYICSAIKNTVEKFWPKGLQDEKNDENCYELKLRGTPWWADGQEAVHSRRLICHILETMASLGYFVITGIDLTRKINDKSVLLFRQGGQLQTSFMCVSLNQTDKIRFINAPQNVVEAGRSIIHHWPLGLETETIKYDGVTYEAKMKGNPWSSMHKGDGIHGRSVLLGLLCQFYPLGWRLVCSADVSAKFIHQDDGPDYPIDVHSWWLMYDQSLLQQTYAPPPPPLQLYPSLPSDAPPAYTPAYPQ